MLLSDSGFLENLAHHYRSHGGEHGGDHPSAQGGKGKRRYLDQALLQAA